MKPASAPLQNKHIKTKWMQDKVKFKNAKDSKPQWQSQERQSELA